MAGGDVSHGLLGRGPDDPAHRRVFFRPGERHGLCFDPMREKPREGPCVFRVGSIQVGNGQRDSTEDIDYIDTPYPAEEGIIENEGGDVDEFKEVQGPINDQ